MDSLSIKALRQALREKGASTKGSKAMLRKRLAALYDQQDHDAVFEVPSKVRVLLIEYRGAKRASCLVQLSGNPNKTLSNLLTTAQNKFQRKSKRAFIADTGVEIIESNILDILRDGVQVFITRGEEYILKKENQRPTALEASSTDTSPTSPSTRAGHPGSEAVNDDAAVGGSCSTPPPLHPLTPSGRTEGGSTGLNLPLSPILSLSMQSSRSSSASVSSSTSSTDQYTAHSGNQDSRSCSRSSSSSSSSSSRSSRSSSSSSSSSSSAVEDGHGQFKEDAASRTRSYHKDTGGSRRPRKIKEHGSPVLASASRWYHAALFPALQAEFKRQGSDLSQEEFLGMSVAELSSTEPMSLSEGEYATSVCGSLSDESLSHSLSAQLLSPTPCEGCKDLRVKLVSARDKNRSSRKKELKAKEDLNKLSIKLSTFKQLQAKHRDALATITVMSKEQQKMEHQHKKLTHKLLKARAALDKAKETEEVAERNKQLKRQLSALEGEESVLEGKSMEELAALLRLHTEGLAKVSHAMAALVERDRKEVQEKNACKICYAAPANVLLQPCCHLVSCSPCSMSLERCPICRSLIDDSNPVYT